MREDVGMMKSSASRAAKPDRALVIVLVVIAALVLVALAAILVRGGPEELDPTSPEGVVQRYSAAVIAGDEPAAMALLSDRLVTDCEKMPFYPADGIRVTLLSTAERGESASVSVLIRISYGSSPFGSGETESRQAFQLVNEQGLWKIDVTPYELTVCDGWN